MMEPTSADRVQQRLFRIIVSEKTTILPRMKEVCLFVHRQFNPKRVMVCCLISASIASID